MVDIDNRRIVFCQTVLSLRHRAEPIQRSTRALDLESPGLSCFNPRMDRRSFLSGFLGAAAALAFDPERLLWVPSAKTIFLPPPGNQFVTMEMITSEALRMLRDNLRFEPTYSGPVLSQPFLVGATVNVRKLAGSAYGSTPQ